ncbi:hypothetical protein Scep_010552 [Stephania cephalantha]|uniref:Uncharacterized protein n=1 Tax=Stephania cephalantha TaxID=152367 RepID=A0AAP0JV91_9MAGN
MYTLKRCYIHSYITDPLIDAMPVLTETRPSESFAPSVLSFFRSAIRAYSLDQEFKGRIADSLAPSFRSTSMVSALDEAFEILVFVHEKTKITTSTSASTKLKINFAKDIWMSKGISNHWFQTDIVERLEKRRIHQRYMGSCDVNNNFNHGCKRQQVDNASLCDENNADPKLGAPDHSCQHSRSLAIEGQKQNIYHRASMRRAKLNEMLINLVEILLVLIENGLSSSVALKAFLILSIVLFGLLTVNSETAGALVDPAMINGAEGEKIHENRHARKLLLVIGLGSFVQ